jgi:hypothetical protein
MTITDYGPNAGVYWIEPPLPNNAWQPGRRAPIRLSVVHTTEGHAGADAAEMGHTIDVNRTDGTSTHVFHDSDSSPQEVLRKDTANSAFFHGNALGIHHELCGTAHWTAADWAGSYQQAMLRRCAKAQADDCITYKLEPRRLSVAEVRRAYYGPAPYPAGICGHIDITQAFPEDQGDHTDPGPNFPWDQYINMVKEEMNGVSSADVIVGESQLYDEAANRSTPTGRNFANDFYALVTASLTDEFKAITDTFTALNATLAAMQTTMVAMQQTLAEIQATLAAGGGGATPVVPTADEIATAVADEEAKRMAE